MTKPANALRGMLRLGLRPAVAVFFVQLITSPCAASKLVIAALGMNHAVGAQHPSHHPRVRELRPGVTSLGYVRGTNAKVSSPNLARDLRERQWWISGDTSSQPCPQGCAGTQLRWRLSDDCTRTSFRPCLQTFYDYPRDAEQAGT